MKRFKLLLSFIKGSKILYLLAIVLCLFAVWISLYVPLVVKVVVDSIIGNKPLEESGLLAYVFSFRSGDMIRDITVFVSLGVIMTLIASVIEFTYGVLINIVAQRAGKNIRDRMYSHIQNLDYEYHAKAETGDLIQRCTTDIENVMNFISEHFITVTRVFFILIVTVSLMIQLNLFMSLVSMILIPVIFTYSYLFFRRVQKAFEAQEETDARISGVLQENLTGIRVVKAFARQEYETKKFDKANKEHKDKTMDIILAMSQYWGFSDGLSFLQISVVLGFGSYFVVTGVFGLGMIIAFFSYVERLMWPVKQLGRLLAETGRTAVSLKRLLEVLNNNVEVLDENKSKPEILGSIEFKDVSFSYPNGTKVLDHVSFKIEPGQTLAIIGPTGAGKTTLVNLLQRLYDTYTGLILLDGIDIQSIDKRYLRKRVSLILQEPFLFNKTVKENLGFAKKSYDDSDIYRTAELSCIHSSIEEFEKGYGTMVGEGGVTLSGGQKQRIAIARTLIQENPIVIFDDSLSAVDTETDRVIRSNLQDGRVKPTSIIISHRISTVREADQIMVLEKGRVTALGNHNEIKSLDNLYKRILDIQSEIEEEFHTVIS